MTRRSPSRALMAAVAFVVSWPILAWSGAASAAAVPYGGPYQIVLPGLPGQCMTAGQTLPGSKLWVYSTRAHRATPVSSGSSVSRRTRVPPPTRGGCAISSTTAAWTRTTGAGA